jgi:S1-C subfamily serine protease
VSRGLLGVNIQDVTPEIAETYGLHDNSGALVAAVSSDSAAERAGIQIGDVIVSINGTHVRDSGSLKYAIGLLRPNQQVRVGLIRDGKEQTVNAVLGALPETTAAAEPAPAEPSQIDPSFEGADLADNSGGAGVVVRSVEPGSPAAEQGLQAGDVITKVNRVPVRNLADATQLVKKARSIILEVQRGSRKQLILMR